MGRHNVPSLANQTGSMMIQQEQIYCSGLMKIGRLPSKQSEPARAFMHRHPMSKTRRGPRGLRLREHCCQKEDINVDDPSFSFRRAQRPALCTHRCPSSINEASGRRSAANVTSIFAILFHSLMSLPGPLLICPCRHRRKRGGNVCTRWPGRNYRRAGRAIQKGPKGRRPLILFI